MLVPSILFLLLKLQSTMLMNPLRKVLSIKMYLMLSLMATIVNNVLILILLHFLMLTIVTHSHFIVT